MRWRWLWLVVMTVSVAHAWGQDEPTAFPRRTPVVIAVEKSSPVVVNISTEKVMTLRRGPGAAPGDLPSDEMLEEFWKRFGMETKYKTRSLGSGVIIHRYGYIVTNEHVVRRASRIQVSLLNGSIYEGKLVSADPRRDLAVIKIDGQDDFPVVEMGNSSDLMIGETVIALGNPFGFSHTVTVGVLSAKNRMLSIPDGPTYAGLLQTDASVNPGSSGGPLLDINGRLIGINTAIRAQAEGIGFAIPVDDVLSTMVDLLNFRQKKMWVGMSVTPVMRRDTREPVGLKVLRVEEKSPAQAAGLQADDILTRMNGQPLLDLTEYEIGVLNHKTGDTLEFDVMRPEGVVKLTVTIGGVALPDSSAIITRRTGMTVEPLDEVSARKAGLNKGEGVLVTGLSPNTPASNAGLVQGDVIMQFNNFRVTQPEELGTLLTQLPLNARALVVVSRKGDRYYAWMTIR